MHISPWGSIKIMPSLPREMTCLTVAIRAAPRWAGIRYITLLAQSERRRAVDGLGNSDAENATTRMALRGSENSPALQEL